MHEQSVASAGSSLPRNDERQLELVEGLNLPQHGLSVQDHDLKCACLDC